MPARVAEKLGIAHYVLDYESRFRAAVIEDFADSYRRGETPIPCIRCNQRVKFRDLLETARDLGAEALATGHYVRRIAGRTGPNCTAPSTRPRPELFPLRHDTAPSSSSCAFRWAAWPRTRSGPLAREFGLPVAEKPDSQDICFVPHGSYADLVERLRPEAGEPGEIVDLDGRVLGRHRGIAHFTVGQRKGLGIAAGRAAVRVAARTRDPPRRGRPARSALAETRVPLGEINWLAAAAAGAAVPVTAKLRSAQPPVAATLHGRRGAGNAELVLDEPAGAVAPGQAAVLYDGERVLGGGWIRRRACRARLDRVPAHLLYARRLCEDTRAAG